MYKHAQVYGGNSRRLYMTVTLYGILFCRQRIHLVAWARQLLALEVATPTPRPFQAAAVMLLPGEVTATAYLPTCDVISARQWSYTVSALSGVHLPDKTTVWRRSRHR